MNLRTRGQRCALTLLLLLTACDDNKAQQVDALVPNTEGSASDILAAPEIEMGEADGDLFEGGPLEPVLECTELGMFFDDELLLSADPLSAHDPQCGSSWIHFEPDGGYDACCDDFCCSWGLEAQDGLPVEGESCTVAEGCSFGFLCPQGTLICRRPQVGEQCNDSVHCEEALYCSENSVCQEPVYAEGGNCSVEGNPCDFPMDCICVGVLDCMCFDGSVGDPCQSDTCLAGLYCAPDPMNLGIPHCYAGTQGDPCEADWQCSAGHGCQPQSNDTFACAALLWADEECAPGNSLVVCGEGLHCSDKEEPNVCIALGQDGEDCLDGDDCADGFHCHAGSGKCWDGINGDPCEGPEECTAPFECAPEGIVYDHGYCHQFLVEGADCTGEGEFVHCLGSLVCSSLSAPPTCQKQSVIGGSCNKDEECKGALYCQQSLGVCLAGEDGVPCMGDDWCSPGWACHPQLLLCFNGDSGDPCSDGQCAEGFYCEEVQNACYDGAPGSPCGGNSDCLSGHCIGLFDGAVCVDVAGPGDACGKASMPYTICGSGLVCVLPVAQCSAGQEGDVCASHDDCAIGFLCNSEEGTCFDGSLGDPCGPTFPCAPGLECSGVSATCVQALEGGGCASDDHCGAGMVCNKGTQACYVGDNGDPCFGPQDCTVGYDCLMPSNQCYDTLLGSPCLDDTWCQWGLSCIDVGELRCVEFLLPEQVCEVAPEFVICPPLSSCNLGYDPAYCAPLSPDGGPCAVDDDCLEPGLCDVDAGLCEEAVQEGTE